MRKIYLLLCLSVAGFCSGFAQMLTNRTDEKLQASPIDVDMVSESDSSIRVYKYLPTVQINGRLHQSYKSDESNFSLRSNQSILETPQSVSTVTRGILMDKMQYSLHDIFTDAAGVNQYSGFDEYTIRGFRAENARMINGLRGYNSTYTSPLLVNIEKVEIIKAPMATLYGNCDPGGSVNLVTKQPLDKQQGSISVAGGSWNHKRIQTDITGPITKDKKLLYRFNGDYDDTKSFRRLQFARSYELAPSFSFTSGNLKINADFSISNIHSRLDRGTPGLQNDSSLKHSDYRTTLSQRGDYLHETDIATDILGSYRFNNHITFHTGYLNYLSNQRVAEHGFHNYITNDSIDLYYTRWHYSTSTNSFTNYLNAVFNTGQLSHNVIVGWDYIRTHASKADQNRYELPDIYGKGSGVVGTFSLLHPSYPLRSVGNYQLSDESNSSNEVNSDLYNTQGVYAQDMVKYGHWSLLMGIGREFYRGIDDNNSDSQGENNNPDNMNENVWLPKFALSYAVSGSTSIYATYDKGFDPFEASSDLQVFKSPFKPIISTLYEVGGKTIYKNKLMATLAIYRLSVKNTAVNADIPDEPDLYVQHGEDLSTGVEAELNGNILPNLSVSLNYTYDVAKVHKSDVAEEVGMWKEDIPRNSSNSWIKYIVNNGPLRNLSIMFGHSQVGRRHTLDKSVELPGYVVFNGGLQYGFDSYIVSLNVNNLFNKSYWASGYNNINKWAGIPRSFMADVCYLF